MALTRLFTDHPASVDETYGEHLAMASSFGLRMVFTGFACLVHALLPFCFVKTGSLMIARLHEEMVTKRNRKAAGREAPGQEIAETA